MSLLKLVDKTAYFTSLTEDTAEGVVCKFTIEPTSQQANCRQFYNSAVPLSLTVISEDIVITAIQHQQSPISIDIKSTDFSSEYSWTTRVSSFQARYVPWSNHTEIAYNCKTQKLHCLFYFSTKLHYFELNSTNGASISYSSYKSEFSQAW